jgi:hypothetical protein
VTRAETCAPRPAREFDVGELAQSFQDAQAGWELAKGGEDAVSKGIANLALAESAR